MSKLTMEERLAVAVRVMLVGLGRSEEARERLRILASTQVEVDAAVAALHRAWIEEGHPVPAQIQHADLLAWVGVDAETFNRAMQEARKTP